MPFRKFFSIPVPYPVDRFSIKGKLTKWNQDVRTATCDCPTLCVFLLDTALAPIAFSMVADLLNAVTGFDFTTPQIEEVGERVINLARLFNAREGFNCTHDVLPQRIMTEPIPAGVSKGQLISKKN